MILFHDFTRVIILLNLYMVVMGDLTKFGWDLKRIKKERLLVKFLMDAESHLTQNCPRRHTTILASKNQLLKGAGPIFQGRPYFVGIDCDVMVQSREYANENCVFVIIDTVDYDHLSMIFSHLPRNYKTKVQIVSTNNLLKDEIKNTLDLAYDKSIENVSITFLQNNEFKAFQAYPFTKNCTREIRPLYVWVPDKGLKTYNYDDYSPRNLNKCSVSVSTLHLEDAITLHENPDGTLHVSGGTEGNLILTFAETLNFTVTVKYPEVQDWEGIANDTIIGLLGDIANKKSLIAFGHLRPTVNRYEYSDFTISYSHHCIVWTTAAIKAFPGDVLYSEFRTYLWLAFMLSIIFSCIFIYILYKIKPNNLDRQTCMGVTLDVTCVTLGLPIHRLSTNRPGKIYFLSYIFFAVVMTVAYKTSLASILTVRNNVQLIKNDADIIRLGLTTGGSKSFLSILKNQQEESPRIPCLIKRYEIIPDIASALYRIKHKHDLAYIRHLSTMQYYKRNLTLSGEDVYFYSFDECIVSYHAIAFVLKGSALTEELNRITRSMLEFGFMMKWNSEMSNFASRYTYANDVKMKKLTFSQLRSMFMLYLSGIFLSTLFVILEIILGTLLKQK